MKKGILLGGIILGIILGAVCGIFKAIPVFADLIWVFFTTYAIVNALGAKFKNFGYYLIVLALGWGYAYGYYSATGLFYIVLGLSLPVALGLGTTIFTVIIVLIHGILLRKTPMGMGMLGLAFAPVISFFGSGFPEDANIYVVIAGVIGLLVAVVAELIIGAIRKPSTEAKV